MSSTAPLLYHTPVTAQPMPHPLPTLLCNTSIAWPLHWPLTSTLTHQTHTYQCECSTRQARKAWPQPNRQPSWQKRQRGGTGTPYHSYDFPDLAKLHSSVNWHLHCTREVYQSFSVGYPWTGLCTRGFLKNPYPDPLKPLPLVAGTGLVR